MIFQYYDEYFLNSFKCTKVQNGGRMRKVFQLIDVIDEDTGEIVASFSEKNNFNKKVLKYEVEKMLKNTNSSSELDSDLLYSQGFL